MTSEIRELFVESAGIASPPKSQMTVRSFHCA
jgi:hypothetical protein